MLLLFPILGGCQLALQDGAPSSQPVKFEGPGESCLDQSLPAVQKFFNGDGDPDKIDEAWSCLSGALKTFETHVRGEDPNRYSAKELQTFIQSFFLKQQTLSDAMVTETMRIKQVILGGNLEYLTLDELKQIHVVLDTFRVESRKMAPYMKILNLGLPKPKTEQEREHIERGIAQMVASARIIGSLMGRSQNSYHLSDMATFLREFGKLYSKDGSWNGPDKFIEQLPTVATLKSFFLRPTGNSIAPDEWQELIAKAARLFSLYVRADYLFTNNLTAGEGLRQISTFTTEAFVILEESVRSKDNKIIEYRQINDLIDRVYKLGKLKLPVDEPAAKSVMKTLIDKICNPAFEGHRDQSYGITEKSLTWLKRDFFGWTEVQEAWDEMNAGNGVTVRELRDRWKKLSFTNKDAETELTALITHKHPLVFTPKKTVILENPAENLKVSRESWTELNWKRLVIRVLIRGFSQNYEAERFTGLKLNDYVDGFEELRPVIEAMDLIKPGDISLRDNLFAEANLFMPSADGNKQLSYLEGTEILSFVLSGREISNPMISETKKKCKQVGKTADGSPKLEKQCYVKLLEDNSDRYFANLPYWVETMKANKGEKWPEFAENILLAIRDKDQLDEPIETGHITKTAVVMQYIESIFMRFDLDKSKTLSLKESMSAYPLLYDILKDASGLDDPDDIEAVFTFLLRYGESPAKNLGNKIKFLLWKGRKSSWQYEADRYQVLRVVANL